jgi:hypothetical protein
MPETRRAQQFGVLGFGALPGSGGDKHFQIE